MLEETKTVVSPPVVEQKPRPVMQEEFKAFQDKVDQGFGKLLEKLDEIKKTPALVVQPAAPVKPVKVEGGPTPDDATPVPPKWVATVHEILGPEFDVRFEQPDSGGARFTIIVPKDKSNANKDHWEMYKHDYRTKDIGNTGLAGVKEYCILVRKNLLASEVKLIQYP